MKYYSHARTALKNGLLHLNLNQNNQILVPSYICDAVLHPIKELGIGIIFYELNKYFSPNWSELNNLCNKKKPDALIMVNYFGQPILIDKYKEFCSKKNILLIEDNAHGYGGKYNGKMMGTFGDIGISSPRKNISLPSGAILYINGKISSSKIEVRINLFNVAIFYNKYFISKYLIFLKIFFLKIIGRYNNFNNPNYFNETYISEHSSDTISTYFIEQMTEKKLIKLRLKRVKKWNKIKKLIDHEDNIFPVFRSINKDTIPWYFPAYIERKGNLFDTINKFQKQGIEIIKWPALPKEIIKKNSKEIKNWEKLICFSLH